MFIAIFVINKETNQKVFRSSQPLSQSKITCYFTEFLNLHGDSESGVISCDNYDFVFTSDPSNFYVAQVDKFSFLSEVSNVLEFIKCHSNGDIFDSLVLIDNCLYNGRCFIDKNISQIVSLESQEEVIFNLMMENKKKEQIEKMESTIISSNQSISNMMVSHENSNVYPYSSSIEGNVPSKPKIQAYSSEKPILMVIKEKINVKIDKENYIQDNIVSGEMSMVINDAKYKQIEVKMKNLQKNLKFSPYLDKASLKKSIFKFEKERQLNKNIPLLKWTGKLTEIPISVEYWLDEEDGKYCSTVTFVGNRKVKNLKVQFDKTELSDLELFKNGTEKCDVELSENQMKCIIDVGSLNRGHKKTFEIKYYGFDTHGVFPMEVTFEEGLESNMGVEAVFLRDNEIKEYEVRKIMEVERFIISNE